MKSVRVAFTDLANELGRRGEKQELQTLTKGHKFLREHNKLQPSGDMCTICINIKQKYLRHR